MCQEESSISDEPLYEWDLNGKTGALTKEDNTFPTKPWKIFRIRHISKINNLPIIKIQIKNLKTLFHRRHHKTTRPLKIPNNNKTTLRHHKRSKTPPMEIIKQIILRLNKPKPKYLSYNSFMSTRLTSLRYKITITSPT